MKADIENVHQLIRMAQVLKMRCRFLAEALAESKMGPQAGAASVAHNEANNCEARLIRIADAMLKATK